MGLSLSPPVFQSAICLKIISPEKKKTTLKKCFSLALWALTGKKKEECQVILPAVQTVTIKWQNIL